MNARDAAVFLERQGMMHPEIAVILGTGLSDVFAGELKPTVSVDYHGIPGFPSSTVQSHQGKLIFGELHGIGVLAMLGRAHYYEGYSMEQITFPVHVMKAMGVKTLIVTNAAGNLNLESRKGDIMLIRDHIDFQPDNPLRGNTIDRNNIYYSPSLITKAKSVAQEKKINLREGVYVSVSGPTLETRSEYRYFGNIGGDAVGMSTVPEVLVANQLGMDVCAFSILTNDCNPQNLQPVNLSDVIDRASSAVSNLSSLLTGLIQGI